jgi:acyl-CoA thioester hydrolase
MQFVYNGKYLEYFEVGRTELLREYGIPYREIEQKGFQLPLIEARVYYKKPAVYDDQLKVEAVFKNMNSARLKIEYKITRIGDNDLIAEGYTEHIFISENSKKPVRPPSFFLEKINEYF